MSKHKDVIKIENPRPGEARYTTVKAARRHCDRQMAEWSGPTSIRLLVRADLDRVTSVDADWEREQEILRRRGGVFYWNGCDTRPGATHEPGTGPSFPRPDKLR